MQRIMKKDGQWAEVEDEMAPEALSFYQNQFSGNNLSSDFFLLLNIHTVVTEEVNGRLTAISEEFDIKKVVFELNGTVLVALIVLQYISFRFFGILLELILCVLFNLSFWVARFSNQLLTLI